MKTEKTIPYKIYLDEQEMPKKWYNVRVSERCGHCQGYF